MTKIQLSKEIERVFRLKVRLRQYDLERIIQEEASKNLEWWKKGSSIVNLADQYFNMFSLVP